MREVDKNELVKNLSEGIEYMRETHSDGVFYWKLGTDSCDNVWAIVLGWLDGFDDQVNWKDDCIDGNYRLCVKLAYQSQNSLMQCDYMIDWEMPYDEQTMEVDDNEISIYPGYDANEIIDELLQVYSRYEGKNGF